MQNNDKISIVMATYNGGEYLKQQLDSFIKQSLQPNELIVSDDNSIDDTVKILKRYKKTAPFDVVIIENDVNVGYARNFEKAILASTGNLIYLCDQDDIWYPNKIQDLKKITRIYPEKDLFIHDTDIADSNANKMGFTKLDQLLKLNLSYDMMAMGTCMVVRRNLIEVLTPFPERLKSHDNWINEIARLLKVRMLIEKSFQLYRIHSTNTSSFIGNKTKKQNFLKHLIYRVTNRMSPKESVRKRKELFDLIENVVDEVEKKYSLEKKEIFTHKLSNEKNILEKRLKNFDNNFINRVGYFSEIIINKNYRLYGNFFTCINDLVGYKNKFLE